MTQHKKPAKCVRECPACGVSCVWRRGETLPRRPAATAPGGGGVPVMAAPPEGALARAAAGPVTLVQEQYCMDRFTPSITNSNKETVPRKILLTVFDALILNVLREIFYVL